MMNVSDYCIFSKHLQCLSIEEAAEMAARAGFTGIDLTVRPGGHVDTAAAKAANINNAVNAIRKAGLSCPMMVTSIVSPDDPEAEAILSAASDSGITHYRTGYLEYDYQEGIGNCLDRFRRQMEKLSRLNEQCGIHGSYQNHGGTRPGAAVWDLWYILKDLDPRWTGCQYDVKHAVMEGGRSWVNGMRAILPWIKNADIKDGIWTRHDDGSVHPDTSPLTEGMVDWSIWRKLLTESGFNGPISLHFEFSLDPENPPEPGSPGWKERMLKVMQQELAACREIVAG